MLYVDGVCVSVTCVSVLATHVLCVHDVSVMCQCLCWQCIVCVRDVSVTCMCQCLCWQRVVCVGDMLCVSVTRVSDVCEEMVTAGHTKTPQGLEWTHQGLGLRPVRVCGEGCGV